MRKRRGRNEQDSLISRQVLPKDEGRGLVLTQTREKQTDTEVRALLQEAGYLGWEGGNWTPGDECTVP